MIEPPLVLSFFISIFGSDIDKNLSNINTSRNINRLTVQVTNSTQKKISTRTWKHLIGKKNMERMQTNFDVVCILTHHFCEMLVYRYTESFKCFGTDMLLFLPFQMGDKWKVIYICYVCFDIKILNLLVRYTTTIQWFDVQNYPTFLNF